MLSATVPSVADMDDHGYQLHDPHRPDEVARPSCAGEVRDAVAGAARRGLRVAVQASGHGRAAGLDGGLLVDTRDLTAVTVDPATRTARVAAGATWQHVVDAAAPHGLAPLSGSAPGVGAVSYTLGGGIGLLARRHGFAADHLRAADLVTVDGAAHRVEAGSELFRALRGGGANLGVVTGMEVGLVPLERLHGGALTVDVAAHPDVLDVWRRWTATVPEEMTSAVSMLPVPAGPLAGRHVAQVQIAFCGPAAEGERLVDPLRAALDPLRDTVRDLPFTESGSVFDEPDTPHAYRSDNRLLRTLRPAALEALTAATGPRAPVMCVVGLRHLGGALARPPREPDVLSHRGAALSLTVLSPLEPGTEDVARAAHAGALAPFVPDAVGRSLSFSYGPLDDAQRREGWSAADREFLAGVARRLDPDARLHVNHPVPR